MFTMAQKPWTPAAQLSVMGLQGASQSYAAMDKKQEFKKPKSNIFGDSLPIVGMAAGAMLGGPLGMTAAQGAMLGSGLGGAVGAAVGGQNAAQLGGMGVHGAWIEGALPRLRLPGPPRWIRLHRIFRQGCRAGQASPGPCAIL